MPTEPAARRQGPRDRPLGLPPRGSRWGMAGFLLLGIVTPMAGGVGVAGLDPALSVSTAGILLPSLGWIVLLIASLTSMMMRRYWGICLGWPIGMVVLIAFPVALAMVAAVPLGLIAATPIQHFLAWYALGWLAVVSPLWFQLQRMLALRFWQPWTRPETWERGDEPAPAWALAVLDVTKPWMADEIRQAEHLPAPSRSGWRTWAALVLPLLVLLRVALFVFG